MDSDLLSQISCNEKIVSRFGRWPSFHDAEIIELSLWRGRIVPEKDEYIFPAATIKLHHWRMTSEVSPSGYFVLDLHTLTTLRFSGVTSCRVEDFNHQNAIMGLNIVRKEASASGVQGLAVTIEGSFGCDAYLECEKIEVVDSVPADANGAPRA